MEIGVGQRYTATAENIATSTSSAFDLIQLATGSTVPIIVDRIVMTAGTTGNTILRVSLLRRSSTGTGGTGITPAPTALGSAAASTTVSYNVTTPGTAGAAIDNQQWNEFAPYEFNQKPGGILVPVSSYLCMYVPASGGTSFSCSFTVEFIELK